MGASTVRALYTATLVVGLAALAPVFLLRGLRRGKYLGSLRERFGGVPERTGPEPALWIHAVSVGEVLAAEPLVRAAAEELRGWRVVVSTTTATGQAVARERFPELEILYFPLDLPFAVSRALDRVRPSAVCIVETEIWPNFLAACRLRGVPVILANGRISDRSFRRYRRAGPLLGPILAEFHAIMMQSSDDADRMLVLGAPRDRVTVAGNLKYDLDRDALEARLSARRAEAERALGLPDRRPLVIAGSTVDGEEPIVARALALVRRETGLGGARLLVAPRHPERFDEAERLLAAEGLRVVRRSTATHAEAVAADVLLLDTIGELAALYAHADVVFVGGSLVARGGHNILEPALYGKPVVVGPHTENFRRIVSDFAAAGAVVQLGAGATGDSAAGPLAAELARLLSDPAAARGMGERGAAVLRENRGATRRTLDRIRAVVGGAASPR